MSKLTNEFTSHSPLEKGKYKEIRKFINTWLTDQAVYCNNCGVPYFGEKCCEHPEIGKNFDHCWAVIIQNKARQKLNANEFASNTTNTMRLGVSMPVKLLHDLERFCKETMGQKLFVNQKDLRNFTKAFPMFAIWEKI